MKYLSTVIVAVMFLAPCDGAAENHGSVDCPSLDGVKTMPFHDESGVDPVYDELKIKGICDEYLISMVVSTALMADPRPAPPYNGFAIGDAAVFVLMRKYDLGFEDFLPANIRPSIADQGVYAYFAFVEEPAQRTFVQDRIRELLRKP